MSRITRLPNQWQHKEESSFMVLWAAKISQYLPVLYWEDIKDFAIPQMTQQTKQNTLLPASLGMFQSRPTNSESMPQWCEGKEVGVEKLCATLEWNASRYSFISALSSFLEITLASIFTAS